MSNMTLPFRLKQHVLSRLTVRNILALACGVALMTLSAKVQLPFWPVPMTLHTLAVMAIAIAFGPFAAFSVMAAYLMTGAMGVPVFSGSPARGMADGENSAWSIYTPQADFGNAEITELFYPILYLGRNLEPDSGGYGKFRGGLGHTAVWLIKNTPGIEYQCGCAGIRRRSGSRIRSRQIRSPEVTPLAPTLAPLHHLDITRRRA